MNSSSYDKRMENMPVFISYPRSGSNWINSVMEIYFNQPRLRRGITFLNSDNAKKPALWFHDHDYFSKLKLTHNNILYLYRNPPDVIYSSLKSEYNGRITDDTVNEQIHLLRNNLIKYLVNNKAPVCIKYENIKVNLNEFKKFILWIEPNNSVDIEKVKNGNKIVSKKALVARSEDKRFFGATILASSYENERNIFKTKYSERILRGVITPELKKFFKGENDD